MATFELEHMLDDWAPAWSSHNPEWVLALFTDDYLFEDVTFGVATRGKEELRSFAAGAFSAVVVTPLQAVGGGVVTFSALVKACPRYSGIIAVSGGCPLSSTWPASRTRERPPLLITGEVLCTMTREVICTG